MGMSIVGYPERLSVAAGESLTFFVSSERPRYRAGLVRLLHGDADPAGPGFLSEPVASNVDGEHPGTLQPIRPGSCAIVPAAPMQAERGFAVAVWIWTGDARAARQTLASQGPAGAGWRLALRDGRVLGFELGTELLSLPGFELPPKTWCLVAASYDAASGQAALRARAAVWPDGGRDGTEVAAWSAGLSAAAGDLVFAAEESQPGLYAHHFNGKLEAPALFAAPLDEMAFDALWAGAGAAVPGVLGAWDFGREQDTDRIVDTGPDGRHGRLRNLPARAMMGRRWTGDAHDFRDAPEQYAAIHFHDDDLHDADWRPSLRLEAPADLPSGIYALHLTDGEAEDHVTFVVTPPADSATSDILFLAPTFSYLAYGNEAMANRPDIAAMLEAVGIEGGAKYPSQKEDVYIVENRLLSCYDIHSDGSGVCYSSLRRPLLSMRPSYRMPLLGLQVRPGGAAHQLPADLCITHWLGAKGFAWDAATDHDLHAQGASLLSRYKVVITGSHPEYCSHEMWDALQAYLAAGGRLMYLGGNGFFCVTSLTADGVSIETRRMRTNRAWSSDPGEERHSTTGELGGIWAMRGRPANHLVGVSTSCVGYTSGAGYARTEMGRDPAMAFIFEGVGDGPIGAFPNLFYGDGAAGFEIDRAEPALGTPAHAVVVASARMADDSYQQVLHELEAPGAHYGATMNPACRADMTWLDYPNGGATWSTGSILWAGGLHYNDLDNDVSRVTENVLRRMLA